MAQQLRIGLFLHAWHSYVREVLGGIREAAADKHWEMYAPWAGMDHWPDPHELRLAGLIVGTGAKASEEFDCPGLPQVRIGTQLLAESPVDVTWDNARIGALAAEHLMDQGHRTLCVWRELGFVYQQERADGFCAAVEAAGLPVRTVTPPTESAEDRLQQLAELPEPCGLFCVSDRIGHELMRLAERVGRRVPESLAVVGAGNDEDYCELAAPPMSSVALPGRQAGRAAVEVLAAKLAEPAAAMPTICVPPTYVAVRRSSDLLAIDDLEVLRALRAIRDEAVDGLTVAQIHKSATVSRRNLEQRFKRVVGRSIGQEITRVRHREACRLLTVSRASVADVADRCGFSTPQRFAAAFAQQQGCSPSAFRAQTTGTPRDG
ncbi:MAG: substrate-binding domain-containing protein [Planctomycetota bacterium]